MLPRDLQALAEITPLSGLTGLCKAIVGSSSCDWCPTIVVPTTVDWQSDCFLSGVILVDFGDFG
jgi:hypothetical protein